MTRHLLRSSTNYENQGSVKVSFEADIDAGKDMDLKLECKVRNWEMLLVEFGNA